MGKDIIKLTHNIPLFI